MPSDEATCLLGLRLSVSHHPIDTADLNSSVKLDTSINRTTDSVAVQRLTREEEQLSNIPEMQIKCSKPHVV